MDHNLREYILLELLSSAKINTERTLDTLQTTNGWQKLNYNGL